MNAADVSVNATAERLQQFQALQEQLAQGDRATAAVTARTLLTDALQPLQRALVLQLQGELLRAEGDRGAAQRVWMQSLGLRFSPQVAFALAELSLLPAVRWQEQPQWQWLIRQLLECGYGAELLRWLLHVLEQYPLDQQRQQLLEALEREHQPLLERDAGFRRRWQRLRRCAGLR